VAARDHPRLGAPLPRAKEAFIDPAKLTRYALDPASPRGRHKAAVFRRALAIDAGDWRYLRDQILAELPTSSVSSVRRPGRAEEVTTWGVILPVKGLNGRELLVRTAWKLVNGRPVLTSAVVAKKRRQPPETGSTM
jgi:hypothetical protein